MTDKDDRSIVVTLTVVTENDEHAIRAAEAMIRVASGLVLDGVNVSLSLAAVPDDD